MNIRTLTVIAIILLFFTLKSTVEATGDVRVDFEGKDNALFHIKNMSPGDSLSKRVIIRNDANIDRIISVKGITRRETGDFSKALTIVISHKNIDVYGGKSGKKTLRQFFSDSLSLNGAHLGTFPRRERKDYIFTVQFPTTAGNEFQSKQVAFDLQIMNKLAPKVKKELIRN